MVMTGSSRNKPGRIGVLMGGVSTEREISLKSGKAVYEALRRAGLEAVPIDITGGRSENIRLLRSFNLDCAFIALHGKFGEDGQIQEILEAINVAYTGSGVAASRLAMDKIASREIFLAQGLAVPRSLIVEKGNSPRATHEQIAGVRAFAAETGFPLVVKPSSHGSSIGLSLVEVADEIERALNLALACDARIVVDVFIKGRELTVGILDEQALPVIEIIPEKDIFDYDAKYKAGMTQYVVPAKLDPCVARAVQRDALSAHKALGCAGCSRVDIILAGGGAPYILEINTIPGMTGTSLLPKAASAVGIEFTQLCVRLLESAHEKTGERVSC